MKETSIPFNKKYTLDKISRKVLRKYITVLISEQCQHFYIIFTVGVDLIKLQLLWRGCYFNKKKKEQKIHFNQNFCKCFKEKKYCTIVGRCQHYITIFTVRGRFDKQLLFKEGFYMLVFLTSCCVSKIRSTGSYFVVW